MDLESKFQVCSITPKSSRVFLPNFSKFYVLYNINTKSNFHVKLALALNAIFVGWKSLESQYQKLDDKHLTEAISAVWLKMRCPSG